jgi:hypothetical protein
VLQQFWGRYPKAYTEGKFFDSFLISEEHLEKLPLSAFEPVCRMTRYPRYSNKRVLDPQVKLFADKCGLKIPENWGLPEPNEAAAYKSLSKYDKPIPYMSKEDVELMNQAWSMVDQHFGPYMCNSRVRTISEVVSKLDLNTSCGAPFSTKYGTKSELFEKDPNFIAWLEIDWDSLCDDDWTCLWTNSLKEEIRDAKKIEENSIRTFTAMATDAIVHGNRLFADQNEKFYASHLRTSSFVGSPVTGGSWHALYEKLNVFPNGYALDESQYDSSLRAYMMWACAEFRFRMLRKEEQTSDNLQRIRNLYRNLVNSLIIAPDGVVVMKKGGNPSGSINTISDNTLILYAMMCFAWLKTAPKNLRSYQNFELHTAKALNGDDNTWTVSNAAHSFYNARSIIEVWKTLGITTTTDSLEPRRARDLDFLSAHTVFVDGVAVPLYDRTKLMVSLFHAPEKHLTPETSLNRAAALLQVGWSDPVFRSFCREFITWLIDEYDSVLFSDERWILAKCSVLGDARLYQLYTGKPAPLPGGEELLYPQSCCGQQQFTFQLNVHHYDDYWKRERPNMARYSESQERSTEPNKAMKDVISTFADLYSHPAGNYTSFPIPPPPSFEVLPEFYRGGPYRGELKQSIRHRHAGAVFERQSLALRPDVLMCDSWATEGGSPAGKMPYWEVTERSNVPNKAEMSTRKVTTTVVARGPRKGRGRGRVRRQRGKVATRTRVIVQRPTKKGRRRGRRGNMQARARFGMSGRQLTGRGPTRNVNRLSRMAEFTETEYVGEVLSGATGSPSNFTVVNFPINIGNSTLFPWASTIAQNFQKYRFIRLAFEFRREGSEFNAASTQGKVMYAVDSDPNDPLPQNKRAMEDIHTSMDAMPCDDFGLIVPPIITQRLTEGFLVRGATLPSGGTLAQYDIGNLFVASQGINGNSQTLGELHVHYTVQLFEPILQGNTNPPPNNKALFTQQSAGQVYASNVAALVQFNATSANGIGGVFSASNTIITLPAGNYCFDAMAEVVNNTLDTTLFEITLILNGVGQVYSPSYTGFGTTDTGDLSLSGAWFYSLTAGTTVSLQVIQVNNSSAPHNVFAALRILAV